jgi:Right handed beta helix region
MLTCCYFSSFLEVVMKLARLFLLSFVSLMAVGSRAYGQANIVENQTTILYVDAKSGLDSNTGSISAPLKTIQAAISKANANNQKKIGTKVIVNAGVYRETVTINPVSNQSTVPLTVQAAVAGTAVLAGSDVVTNWNPESTKPGAYVASWKPVTSTCAIPSGWPTNFNSIALHTEMIFLNGAPLTQVLNWSQMAPGTFYNNPTYSTLHIWPPAGTNMSTAVVEAATRSKTLSIVGRTNVVLRGLVFKHAASCINNSGATVTSSSNILIDSVQALWNNWGGIGVFSTSNYTVQNSVANYNGGVGIQGTKAQNGLYSFNESDYNNWRGAQAAFYDWGMGGTKLFQMRNISVQNHYSYNNQAQGLWFDTDNKNITVNNATLVGNVQAALQIERNEGPVSLQNSHLCSSGTGVNVLTSQKVSIQNNVFYNNGATNSYQAQIYLAGQKGGKVITDWQTGQSYDLFTTGMVVSGNTFVSATSGQYVFGTYLSGSDWSDFANTLSASNNIWYDMVTPNSFRIVNGKNVNLGGWQEATGTDYTSRWESPASSPVAACTAPTASYADFNVNLDNRTYTMSGGKATATARVNSFGYGSVSLSVTGMPSGVSAYISNANLASGVATVTLSAKSSATNKTVPITLWAVSGSRIHSVTFSLNVVHP